MNRKVILTGVSLACIVLITSGARADGTPECNSGILQGTTECGANSLTIGGFNQTVVGQQAIGFLPDGTAVGTSSLVASGAVLSVPYTPLNLDSSTALGSYTFAIGLGNLAVGAQAGVGLIDYDPLTNSADFAAIDGGTAIGDSSRVTANNGTALGFGAAVSGQAGIAIGAGTSTGFANAIVIGDSATTATATGAIAIGSNADATGGPNTIAIGLDSTAVGNGSTALGWDADTSGANAVSLGAGTDSTLNAVAIGGAAQATSTGSIALGQSSDALAVAAVAIGQGAQAIHANSVALGADTSTTAANQVNVGGRTIGGVANGVALTDAVNLGQLNAATAGIAANIAAINSSIIGLQDDVGILYDQNRRQDRNINKANEGVAMALAMESPNVPEGSRFAVSGGIGGFQGRNALATAISAAVGEKATVSAGLGYGLNSGEIGYRAGFQVAF